jgi:hypothetical protein
LELVHLGLGQEHRVIERVPRQREAEALDGVGEDDDRGVGNGIRLSQDLQQAREIVAGEIGDDVAQVLVGNLGDREQDVLAVGNLRHIGQTATHLGAVAQADERLVLLIAHLVDSAAQGIAAGAAHGGLEPRSVLGL